MRTTCTSLACFLAFLASTASADEAGIEFFEKRIRPILQEHCAECHSTESKKLGGNLLLDRRDGIIKGGETGTAVEVGNPDASLLIKAVRYADDVKMPPKGKLPATAIADLEEWVKRGLPDPRDKPAVRKGTSSWEQILSERRNWWSLLPVQDPPLPQIAQTQTEQPWSEHPLDRFILAKLEANKLRPAAAADPRTLARRLGLVLTGLPPDRQLVESFVQQCGTVTESSPLPSDAVERLVDTLLDSPHFGERWARHWMDVVRFTETHGNEWNYEVHHAWRYRDYLIRAFNEDLPYHQFIREHIAGDLLPQPRWNQATQSNESVIATGFYRFGEVNHDDCIALREIGYDLLDNQIDTLSKAFQATTIACARCHDHKLDAVSMHDYYGLLGILRSSRLVSHTIDAPDVNAESKKQLRELKHEFRKELADLWLADAAQLGQYMKAAVAKKTMAKEFEDLSKGLETARIDLWVAALSAEKTPMDDPFEPWRNIVTAGKGDGASIPVEWKKIVEKFTQEEKVREDFNASQFVTFADFRKTIPEGWQIGGLGASDGISGSGDFAIHSTGDAVVKSLFPAGLFTNSLSEKLNGTLRSPVLPVGKKSISFQVIGQRSSAVRLVSNNCQLNYSNYKALTTNDLHWKTFTIPEDRESLRTYAELMTMFDNPKFPDQLSSLGGDGENYRMPWEKAAANPRSWFGITQVVLHDGGEAPRATLTHFRPLWDDSEMASLDDVAARYATVIQNAIRAWSEGKATEYDVRWLSALRRRDLLTNRANASPRMQQLVEEYRRVELAMSVPRVIAGIGESGAPYDQPIFVRGDCRRPGETASRRYLEVLAGSRDPFVQPGSGRLQLADQIASPSNPLTARVIVNRVWHHLFGTGLVRTVDDFGHVGDLPSHPELLDHLATQFVKEGWSLKRLMRTIVLSRTFQQAAHQSSEMAREVDPQNRWLWHYPARRMEAETIRDSILATSGRLDPLLYGSSIQPFRDRENSDRRLFPGPLDGNGRRSVYIKNNLMEGPKFLEAFNFPGGKVTQGRRDMTNVPAQALALLNDPFVLQQADYWAAKLVNQTDDSLESRVNRMFESSLGRLPSSDERQRFSQAVMQFAELEQVNINDVLKNQAVWKDLAHAIFNLKEFIFIP